MLRGVGEGYPSYLALVLHRPTASAVRPQQVRKPPYQGNVTNALTSACPTWTT